MKLKTNIIYNSDCLIGMKSMPDECIDCIITDPPYKIITGGVRLPDSKYNKTDPKGIFDRRKYLESKGELKHKWLKNSNIEFVRTGKMFKHNQIKFKDWLSDLFRILKNKKHCYIMVNDRNVQEMLNEAIKVGFKLQNILVWHKQNKTPNKYYMKNCEFVLMFRKGSARNINNMGSSQLLRIDNKIGNKFHPTEKPVKLFDIFVENSTDELEICFDPFIGGDTLALSCIDKNRKYIGYEIDKEYYDISMNRINGGLKKWQ